MEQERTTDAKEQLLMALENHFGMITSACEAVGISRQTFYRWMKEDEEFKTAVDAISERSTDYVEDKLFQLIGGMTLKTETQNGNIYRQVQPNIHAIRFYLSHKGKARGYTKKDEQKPPYTEPPIIILNPQGEKPIVTYGGGVKTPPATT